MRNYIVGAPPKPVRIGQHVNMALENVHDKMARPKSRLAEPDVTGPRRKQ